MIGMWMQSFSYIGGFVISAELHLFMLFNKFQTWLNKYKVLLILK